ncbi:MAG: hypothetical protein ISS79_06605 [Phycisphaerae bacterium]|nr:hypothetical protein [Phycisphaerae bacterium]
MAKLTFSLEELISILNANEVLPSRILRPRVRDNTIHFVIRTGSFILPLLPASITYSGLEGNNAIFDLNIVSGRLNKVVSRLDRLLELDVPACMKLDYPKLIVDVDKLLKDKNISGVRVKEIYLENGRFTIVTCM